MDSMQDTGVKYHRNTFTLNKNGRANFNQNLNKLTTVAFIRTIFAIYVTITKPALTNTLAVTALMLIFGTRLVFTCITSIMFDHLKIHYSEQTEWKINKHFNYQTQKLTYEINAIQTKLSKWENTEQNKWRNINMLREHWNVNINCRCRVMK